MQDRNYKITHLRPRVTMRFKGLRAAKKQHAAFMASSNANNRRIVKNGLFNCPMIQCKRTRLSNAKQRPSASRRPRNNRPRRAVACSSQHRARSCRYSCFNLARLSCLILPSRSSRRLRAVCIPTGTSCKFESQV